MDILEFNITQTSVQHCPLFFFFLIGAALPTFFPFSYDTTIINNYSFKPNTKITF